MKAPEISIIMPCYKAELTIHRAVDSIISQTFTNWELILVDDGSPDGTGTICDDYALKDQRIIVLHQINQGVAMARQHGLDAAKGEYTIHADPDDWVEQKWLERLYNKSQVEGADITICNISKCDCGIFSVDVTVPYENPKELFEALLRKDVHASLCNKLIKRELYVINRVCFIKDLNVREDFSVLYKLVYYSKKMAHVEDALYVYDVSNEHSLTHHYLDERHRLSMYLLTKDLLNFSSLHSDVSKQLKDHALICLLILIRQGDVDNEKISELLHFYKNKELVSGNGVNAPVLIGTKRKAYHFVKLYLKIITWVKQLIRIHR